MNSLITMSHLSKRPGDVTYAAEQTGQTVQQNHEGGGVVLQ
jgi:hypothetical protein